MRKALSVKLLVIIAISFLVLCIMTLRGYFYHKAIFSSLSSDRKFTCDLILEQTFFSWIQNTYHLTVSVKNRDGVEQFSLQRAVQVKASFPPHSIRMEAGKVIETDINQGWKIFVFDNKNIYLHVKPPNL